jgi:hypothetical protein
MLGENGDPKFAGRMRQYHRGVIESRVLRFLRAGSRKSSRIAVDEIQPIIDTAVGAFEGTIRGRLDRDCSDDDEIVAARCLAGVAAVLGS